jgi:hypothetical protein
MPWSFRSVRLVPDGFGVFTSDRPQQRAAKQPLNQQAFKVVFLCPDFPASLDGTVKGKAENMVRDGMVLSDYDREAIAAGKWDDRFDFPRLEKQGPYGDHGFWEIMPRLAAKLSDEQAGAVFENFAPKIADKNTQYSDRQRMANILVMMCAPHPRFREDVTATILKGTQDGKTGADWPLELLAKKTPEIADRIIREYGDTLRGAFEAAKICPKYYPGGAYTYEYMRPEYASYTMISLLENRLDAAEHGGPLLDCKGFAAAFALVSDVLGTQKPYATEDQEQRILDRLDRLAAGAQIPQPERLIPRLPD